jgi:Raf kinase inhibitor-like YbhB/YbcL family protein
VGRCLTIPIALVLVTAACSSSTVEADSTSASTPASASITTTEPEVTTMNLTSPAFRDGEPIPPKHSCNGANISPQLDIDNAPAGTAVLVLIMDDPDAPVGTWDHWIAYDIEPTTTIAEDDGSIGTRGLNSWMETGYGGPCPPSGTHRYFFEVFALDAALGLGEGSDKAAVVAAMEGHILEQATLMGTFTR